MDQLRSMRIFVRVADEGSFAAASRALDLAPAIVTRAVADLEEHLGARLMNRTTRRVTLTEVGEDYLSRARQILADIDEAEIVAGVATSEPRGVLKILVPPAFATHQLVNVLPEFYRQYPHIRLEIYAPGPVDTLDENYDVTLLFSRAPLEGEFVARRLASSEVVLCASPDYLDRRGRPKHPSELVHHDAMLPISQEIRRGISFVADVAGDGEPPETYSITPRQPILATSHLDIMYAGALNGLGIAGLSSFVVQQALHQGRLERVLPSWRMFSMTLWAAMPSRKHVPARTRAFLDFMLKSYGSDGRDPWLSAAGCKTQPLVKNGEMPGRRLPSKPLAG